MRTEDGSSGVITLATGPDKYVDFAIGLASSLRKLDRWRGPIAVISDRPPRDFAGLFDEVIRADPSRGGGVEQKLSLDLYSPYTETLFIDCDSLVFRSLDPTFRMFRESGNSFGVLAGRYVVAGDEHYGIPDVEEFLRLMEVERLPAFNSGIIWWRADGGAVFEEARRIAARVSDDALRGFKTARLPDEPIFGAAMERLGVGYAGPRTDHLLPTFAARSLRRLDVVSGVSTIETSSGLVEPAVVHFNVAGQDSLTYARERRRAARPDLSRPLALLQALPTWTTRHAKSWAGRTLREQMR